DCVVRARHGLAHRRAGADGRLAGLAGGTGRLLARGLALALLAARGVGGVRVGRTGVGGTRVVARLGATRVTALVGGTQAELGRAGGPRAPALAVQDLLGDGDLLGLGGVVGAVGVLTAAEALPRGGGELQAAVEAVAGVDAPVAAALALSEPLPRVNAGGLGGRGGHADEGHGGGYAGDSGCLADLVADATRRTDTSVLAFGHAYLILSAPAE